MRITKTRVRLTAAVALIALALTGCAPAETHRADNGTPESQSSDVEAAPTQAPQTEATRPPFPKDLFEKSYVKVVDASNLNTLVVTPFEKGSLRYGENLKVNIERIVAPAEGECGYDDAAAFASTTLSDDTWVFSPFLNPDNVWVDEDGALYGNLEATWTNYTKSMLQNGFAYLSAPDDVYEVQRYLQDEAKAAGTGLWGSCPNFGR